MAVTRYYSFGGEILGEETGGVRRDYSTDALGSVTATVTGAGTVENTYRYKPYGETLAKTGAGTDPEFRWNGKLGYRSTELIFTRFYVRGRHYDSSISRWSTVDPVWPRESAYNYASLNPTNFIDYNGLYPLIYLPGLTIPWPGVHISKPPKPSEIINCLNTPPRCANKRGRRFPGRNPPYGQRKPSIEMMLCVFSHETDFGRQPPTRKNPNGIPPGGIGSVTPDGFQDLVDEAGCVWLKKFKNYQDFVAHATPCEKARASQDEIAFKGLVRFGPHDGLEGDYGAGDLMQRVKNCEKCIKNLPPMRLGHCMFDRPDLIADSKDAYDLQYRGCFKSNGLT